MRRLLPLLFLPFALSSCVLLALGAGGEAGVSTAEDRSYGTKVDDHAIYVNVTDQFVQSGHDGLVIDATVNVRYKRVMLTGNMQSQAAVDKAVSSAKKVKGVKEVINAMVVNPDAGIGTDTNDVLIHKNLVAKLLLAKDVKSINYSSDVVNGVAYIIGRVKDRSELNRVLNVARSTKGVKRVVSYLEIGSDLPNGGRDDMGGESDTSAAAPVAPVVNQSAPVGMAPTEGTVSSPDSVSSSDLNAPSSTPASTLPSSTKPAAWK